MLQSITFGIHIDKDVDLDAHIQNSNYTIHNNMIDTVADIPML